MGIRLFRRVRKDRKEDTSVYQEGEVMARDHDGKDEVDKGLMVGSLVDGKQRQLAVCS